MNPAALGALARGDVANFLVASTPGGIEAQEAAGQADLVNGSDRLPKDILGWTCPVSRAEITAATGIQFGAGIDDLFVSVTLPNGWSIKATDHSMHSKLLDASGVERASIFYKAAFYDRKASITFNCRYRVDMNWGGDPVAVSVVDGKTKAVIHAAGECASRDYERRHALESQATEWLSHHHPEHRNPMAYWAD
ncbi:MAG: hypothetical protein V4738_14305 [Pseudomonadota bacterium]